MVDPNTMEEPPEPEADGLWWRLLWSVIMWALISLAGSLLVASTVVQFIIMVVNKGKPNAEIAWFGQGLGSWLAKAARYQTAASEDKPWPWSPMQ